jgi:hypothetical protein
LLTSSALASSRPTVSGSRSGGDPGLAAGRLGRPLDLGDAAEQVQADPAHRQAGLQGHDRVAELVDQDGQVEQQREGQRHRVPPVPDAGHGVLDPRRESPGDQAGHEEPGGGHVDRHPERPGDDDAAVAHPADARRWSDGRPVAVRSAASGRLLPGSVRGGA